MNRIHNDEHSKMTSKVTLECLLNFIDKNLSTRQPASEIIVEKKVSLAKSIPKQSTKTFSDMLNSANTPIIFDFDPSCQYLSCLKTRQFFTINPNCILSDSDNLSFFKSVLYCLIDKITNDDINQFKTNLIKEISNYSGLKDYKNFNWKKKDIVSTLTNNIVDEKIIRLVSDYLHVNIFMINNCSKGGKYISYGGGEYVPFKKNIVLYKQNEMYYPIFTKTSKFFKVNDSIIKCFIENSEKIKLLTLESDTFIPVEENLDKYIDITKIDFNDNEVAKNMVNSFIEEECSSSENEISDIENNKENNKENKEMLGNTNMSLKDLQEIARKYGISIKKQGKLKTKKELCVEINKK